ncbi:MAG: type II toxin-antitoxin system YafQ family toxin [Pseudomonadota bacterium]
MRKIKSSTQFKKDYKRISKHGYRVDKLAVIISLLAEDKDLPKRCRPHKLSGDYEDFWECHIEADWLLIYEYAENELRLRRTGTHSDLFK